MSRALWTTAEIRLLKTKYASSSKEEMCKLIPRHTWVAIQSKASDIGAADLRWTAKELEILRANYPTLGSRAALKLLPGRSHRALRGKVLELGLKTTYRPKQKTGADHSNAKLDAAEIEAIQYWRHSVWPGKSTEEIAKDLKVSAKTVRQYIRRAKPDYIPPQFRGAL